MSFREPLRKDGLQNQATADSVSGCYQNGVVTGLHQLGDFNIDLPEQELEWSARTASATPGLSRPLSVENRAVVCVSRNIINFPLERSRRRLSYRVRELGTPYLLLRDVLKHIEDSVDIFL